MPNSTEPSLPSTPRFAFRNPQLSESERVEDLIARLTLAEKISCLATSNRIPRLGIRGTSHLEGIHGLRLAGIGMMNGEFVSVTTTFPQAIGLGATWNPDLIQQIASAEGYETRYCYNVGIDPDGGSLIVMAPNADLGRDPRWGRTEECYGEDPFLAGSMVCAFVRGLQGDDPRGWQAASLLKHFLANSNEDNRDSSSSDFDERLWREYYSVPFRMGIMEAGASSFMAAYNRWNGVPCHVHPMLKEITVDEWGTDGIICTDGNGFQLLVTAHKYFPDLVAAAEATIKAGITKYLDDYQASIESALEQGLLIEMTIDDAIRPNLRVMARLGLLDDAGEEPYAEIGGEEHPWDSPKHQLLARRATQESIVLLKNEGSLLPLEKASLTSIAVIGPRADAVSLDWYSGVPPYSVSPLEGIRAAVGADVRVEFAQDNLDGRAVALARECDVVILCVGNDPISGHEKGWATINSPSEGREAVDRQIITLDHEDLIQEVFAVNPRIVVVLISSFPYAINWTQAHVPAIVHMAHNSQEEGNALADVLFGDYNPAGRTVQTWPTSLEQLPPLMDYDIRNGRTYQYFDGEPLYPFGFGLSYTTFAFGNLRTDLEIVPAHGSVTVMLEVTNTGNVAGDEVVQLYVRHLDSKVSRPMRELRAFARVNVEPGSTRLVTLKVPAHRLAYWDVEAHEWVIESGRIELSVGPSSVDLPLTKIIHVEAGQFPPTALGPVDPKA